MEKGNLNGFLERYRRVGLFHSFLTLTLCTLSTLTLPSLGSDQSAPNQTIEPKQIESMMIWWSRSKKAPRIYIDTRIGLSGPYVPSIISGRLCYVSIEL